MWTNYFFSSWERELWQLFVMWSLFYSVIWRPHILSYFLYYHVENKITSIQLIDKTHTDWSHPASPSTQSGTRKLGSKTRKLEEIQLCSQDSQKTQQRGRASIRSGTVIKPLLLSQKGKKKKTFLLCVFPCMSQCMIRAARFSISSGIFPPENC